MSNAAPVLSLLLVSLGASACWPAEAQLARRREKEPSTRAAHTEEADAAEIVVAPTQAPADPAQPSAVDAPRSYAANTPSPPASRVDGCAPGTFFDPRGECWSCPRDYDRTLFPVTAGNACEKGVQVHHRAVSGKMNATGLIKTDCKRGWFLHGLSGVCYRCPAGYNRTIFAVEGATACERLEAPLWTKATFHKKLTCGNSANRACTLLERVPSCDTGLKENARGVCEPLAPGENPFLAGIGEKSKALAELGTQACHDVMKSVPSVSLPANVATMSLECRRRAMIGFTCELPGMIDQVSQLTDYAAKFSRAWEAQPCSAWAAPVRPLCAAAVATIGDAAEVLSCVGAAVQAGVLGDLDTGEVCEASGQIAFQIATLRNLGKLKPGTQGESRLDQLKRMLVNTGKVAKGATQISQQLDRIAECRILD